MISTSPPTLRIGREIPPYGGSIMHATDDSQNHPNSGVFLRREHLSATLFCPHRANKASAWLSGRTAADGAAATGAAA